MKLWVDVYQESKFDFDAWYYSESKKSRCKKKFQNWIENTFSFVRFPALKENRRTAVENGKMLHS